jgi:hypothetical protein
MNELVSINSKVIDKKIAKVYADLDMEKLMKLLDRKLNRDDAEEKFNEIFIKIANVERALVKTY